MRVSCPDADLSAEPDVVYVSDDALDSGRVRLVQSATGEPDSYVELEGAPDLVVEIVSDNSVAKDTQRCRSRTGRRESPSTGWWTCAAKGSPFRFARAAQAAMNRWRRITRGFNGPRSSTGGFAWIAGGTREDGWCSICNRGSVTARQSLL